VSFLGAGLLAPAWGKFADLYGRKLILMRASLAMAICMSMIGTAQNVWQLVFWRLLAGVLGGYASGAVFWWRRKRRKATRVGRSARCPPACCGHLARAADRRRAAGADRPARHVLPRGVSSSWRSSPPAFSFARTTRRPRAQAPAGRSAWSMIPDRRPVIAMLVTRCC